MGEIIKDNRPDYIAQEIAIKVQYQHSKRDDICLLNCATHFLLLKI